MAIIRRFTVPAKIAPPAVRPAGSLRLTLEPEPADTQRLTDVVALEDLLRRYGRATVERWIASLSRYGA